MHIFVIWFLVSVIGVFVESRLPPKTRENTFVEWFFMMLCFPVLVLLGIAFGLTFLLLIVSNDKPECPGDCLDEEE